MRILHVTDSHGTVKSPESRTDLYYISFLKKLAELTYAIKLHKVDMIVHTGDLFHSSRVSNKFMGQVAEIIKTYNVPMYVVPGNHDIDGYNIDTIDQTSLGLLAKTGVITLLTRDNPLRIDVGEGAERFSIGVSGQEYYSEIDTGNYDDFQMQQPECDINILGAHSYVADTPQHPNIRCTYPKDIITDADIVLCGHYHRSFEVECGDTNYYNPGSMLRIEMTDYNKKNMPQYGILDIELDATDGIVYDYKFHKFRVAQPGANVFDFNTSGAIKKHGITLENFKTSIANTMQNVIVKNGVTPLQTITNVIQEYTVENSLDAIRVGELSQTATTAYNEASNQITNDDVISTKGFVPSQNYIRLKSVDIENFQSHEKTHIDFSDGLNIVVGESNSGKTSVFRLIDWVIDNSPLGTDFIMTGKNYCKGVLTYDNGTIIERYRTLKDTGYYKITAYNDITGQFETTEYKGFTNNIPVEVMNAHQTPKISITKNIETHLNIMNQLERPFLITESPNEKAVAIGRITGTNVVDKAIENNVAEIASDKKIYKKYLKDKVDAEKEMALIPHDNLQKLKVFYTKANAKIVIMQQLINKQQDLLNNKNSFESSINYYKGEIAKKEIIVANKSNIIDAENQMQITQRMIALVKSYEQCKVSINNSKEIIKKCKSIVKHKKQIEESATLINHIEEAKRLQNIYTSQVQTMEHLKSKIDTISLIIAKKSSVQKQELLINKINSLMVFVTKSVDIVNSAATISTHISELEGYLQNLISERTLIETDMNNYVLSIGKCPCCGQDITTNNVVDIINNFSKED